MSKLLDTFVDRTITEVRDKGGYWLIQSDDGWWLAVEKAKCESPPRVGQTARYYGRGIGYPVRGLDIDGVEVYYVTEQEHRDRMNAERLARDVEKKAIADAERAERDARVAALPNCFQKRIARFRRNNPDFYWQYEDYEMAACVDAVKIAEHVGSAEAIEDFYALPWEEQKRRVPDLSDGHSGNTFGMACRLAYLYLTDERLVFAEHAAISPLVGCEEAGCPPVTDDEMRDAGYEPLPSETDG